MNIKRAIAATTLAYLTLFGLFALGIWYYGKAVVVLIDLRGQVHDEPELWIVPTPLPDTSIPKSPGRKFTYYGYEFAGPDADVKQEQKRNSSTFIVFSNGEFILIHDPAKTIRSTFDERSKILLATPRDLRFSFSRTKMSQTSFRLMIKPIYVIPGKHLYSFQTEWMRGFQDSTPTQDPAARITAFDTQDQVIELDVGTEREFPIIPQEEVNRVIFSLRPAARSQ